MPRTPLAATAATAVAVASLVAPAPAHAAFDPIPMGCDAHLSPWAATTLFSTRNPNPSPTYVEYGSDNLVLESPNFRPGQPETIPAGHTEALWAIDVLPTEEEEATVHWYLSGGRSGTDDAACEGPGAPRNVVPPTIDGAPTAGSTVTLDPGVWTGSGVVQRRAWVESCDEAGCLPVPIDRFRPGFSDHLDAPTPYAVSAAQVGRRLRVVVAGYSWRGVSLATSALSAPVSGATPAGAPSTCPTCFRAPPQIVGSVLVTPTRLLFWPGAEPRRSFQWDRCAGDVCAPIAGATDWRYRPTPDDDGFDVRVTVTATNADGTGSDYSLGAPVSPALRAGSTRPLPLAGPELSGTAREGEPLVASAGDWSGTDATPAFAWQRCTDGCRDITGADRSTYTPTSADVGAALRVVVTATGPSRTWTDRPATTTAASAPSAPVTAAPPADPVPAPPAPPAPAPPSPPATDVLAPLLDGLSLKPPRFGAKGTTLRLTSSEQASLLLQVARSNRPKRVVARLSRAVTAGAQRLHLGRRLGTRTLPPGRYTLTLVATDAAGNASAPRTLRFRVVR